MLSLKIQVSSKGTCWAAPSSDTACIECWLKACRILRPMRSFWTCAQYCLGLGVLTLQLGCQLPTPETMAVRALQHPLAAKRLQ